MEENVALETSKQKKFVKSIKGIKKLIKKNIKDEVPDTIITPPVKDRVSNKKYRQRGLVYLSHIPHGFYEPAMTQYFKQFGMVTNVRVIRSKRTGNSKGHAFVEFREPAVAQIVADTMNNYLMGKRLIKAAYIPPEKVRQHAMRKKWNPAHNPGKELKIKMKKAYNENKDEKGEMKRAKHLLSNLAKTKKKLSEIGINYDFFSPVDVPEGLMLKKLSVKKEEDKIQTPTEVKEKKQEKLKIKKEPTNQVISKTIAIPDPVKSDKTKNKKKATDIVEVVKSDNKSKNKKNKVQEIVVDKKEQKDKQKKMKDAGVKLPENFIQLPAESGDESDSSFEFDSDEYDKMLEDENDNSDSSGEEDGDSVEEDDDDDDDEEVSEASESEEESVPTPPPKKGKGKHVPLVALPQKQSTRSQNKGNTKQDVKRKAPQKVAVAAKKPKFEKQGQKPMKKQFKKK